MTINQTPKTIFITSFQGLISRVLASGFLAKLRARSGLRIVLLVPDFKKEYFQTVFGSRGVIVEGVSKGILPRRAYLFHKLSFVLLNTRTMRLTRRSFRGYRRLYQFLLAQTVASIFGRWRLVRSLFRAINYHFSGRPIFDRYFSMYQPDLVFSTDIKDLLDTQLVIEAKKRGILTIGMVRSWDYLTGKGLVRVRPDKLVVHNEVIREEAIRYIDLPARDIFVSGIPHYDPYINEKRSSRGEFFGRIGSDPDKRLIFYAPWGAKFADTDRDFVEMLGSAIKEGRLPGDLQILVRMPPTDTVDWSALAQDYPIIIDYPGVRFGQLHRKANEMNYQDLLHLADSLYHSELVVAPPSTIAIDAAVFDKPVVLMAFDGLTPKSYYQGITHYYDFDHIRQLVGAKAHRLARNQEELITAVRCYLENPGRERSARRELVKAQCWKLDGQSSRRLADFLLSFIDKETPGSPRRTGGRR